MTVIQQQNLDISQSHYLIIQDEIASQSENFTSRNSER